MLFNVLQSSDQTLLLEPVNAYRRAIQYQQLEKLQKAAKSNQGFFYAQVQGTVCLTSSHSTCSMQNMTWIE